MAQAELDLIEATGYELMQLAVARHRQYPYVYEEQSMVLVDRKGNRDTRKLRRYSRLEENQEARFLLVFDSPETVRGVAVLAEISAQGKLNQSLYLPALGQEMIQNSADGLGGSFLGTDFSVEDLVGEDIDAYQYRRRRDELINDVAFFVVDVYSGEILDRPVAAPLTKPAPTPQPTATPQLATTGLPRDSLPLRRHFLIKENFFIARTDYFDERGVLAKRFTQYDLVPVLGDMWRANMLLMENPSQLHKTFIKITRRVFSVDYVPVRIFTEAWLVANRSIDNRAEENADGSHLEPVVDTHNIVRDSNL